MSTSHPQPDMSDTEELVAYLDGELPRDVCHRVEERLTTDPGYRRQFTALDQAWSALDELPPTAVNDDFARTTIEMVAVAAERDVTEQSAVSAGRRRRQSIVGAAICVGAALAAFVAVRALVPIADNTLLAELPVIIRLEALAEIDDVEFLDGLQRIGIDRYLREEASPRFPTVDGTSAADWETLDGRRAWIEQLPAYEKAELAARFSRYQNLLPAERQRLQALSRNVDQSPRRHELLLTLAVYDSWWRSQTAGEQQRLREMPTDERLRRVGRLVRQEARETQSQLSFEDEQAIQEAVLEFVEQRRPELLRELSRRGNPDPQRQVAGRSRAFVALAMIHREMRDDRRGEAFQEQLIANLSSEKQQFFESLRGRERPRQLWRWMFEALQPRFGPRELEEFFVKNLTHDQRADLLGLPQVEMKEHLQRLYMDSQVGLRDRDWSGDFGRPVWPGRGGPPPDGPLGGRHRGPRGLGPRDGPPPPEHDDQRRERFDREPPGPPPNGRPGDWHDGPPPEFGQPRRDSRPAE